MTTAQKIIKYLAVAFAIFLIMTIISAILSVILALSGILGLKTAVQNSSTELIATTFENAEIDTLNIDIAFTNLTIKQGEILKIETDNSNIDCKQKNQELHLEEKDYKWFSYNNVEKELILYIPEDLEFEKVKINAGAGKVTILSGKINDLDFDMGVGEANITADLLGKSEINAGVGELNINLQGEKESYKIKADKRIGSIKIDGKEVANGEVYGDGKNYIEIDGGIGSINIYYK